MDNPPAITPSVERLPDPLPGDDTPLPSIENGKGSDVEGSLAKPSRKATAPPKRPLTTSKRPAVPATSSTSNAPGSVKPIASRATPGIGLNKPPTRPTVTARSTKLATTVTNAPSAASEQKQRPSANSVDDGKRAGTGSESENKKPLSSAPSKRISLNPANTSRSIDGRTTPSMRERRSTLTSTASTEKKPSASRPVSSSPMKEALRTTTNNARPSAPSTTPRSTRPLPSSSRVAPSTSSADASRKRLSTIPASPAQPLGSPTDATSSNAHRITAGRSTRPALGERKSTMSITIEQRLREMELVSDMLQIAMAEEGAEDDEIKEDYAKRADETLAVMRAKLEEARRNEGKPPIDPLATAPVSATAPSNVKPEERRGRSSSETSAAYKAELDTARSKIARLELEIEAMSSKTQEFSKQAERASKEVQQATEAIRAEHITKIEMIKKTHASELGNLREQLKHSQSRMQELSAEAERVSKDVQKATDAIRQEHKSKIDVLSRDHNNELNELGAQNTALEAKVQEISAKADRATLETQRATEMIRLEHASKIEALSKDHASQSEEAAKGHAEELKKLRKQLVELQTMAQGHSLEMDRARAEIQRAKENLEAEHASKIDTLSTSHNAELERTRSQLKHSQEELEILRVQSIKDLEAARQTAKEESFQDTAKTLGEQKEKHECALQALQERLASEEQSGMDSTSKVEQLSIEITSLTEQLHEQKRQHQGHLEKAKKEQDLALAEKEEALTQLETVKTENKSLASEKEEILTEIFKAKQEYESSLAQIQEALGVKDKELLSSQQNLEELRSAHSRELKDLQTSHDSALDELFIAHGQKLETSETTARERLQSIESDYATSKAQLSEMEKSIEALSAGHKEALRTKDQELSSVARVIESLQDEIQEMQQGKARELEGTVLEVKQDHEKSITQVKETAKAAQKDLEKTLTTARADHENEIWTLRQQIESSENTHDKALKELEASKDDALALVKVLEKDRDEGLESRKSLEKGLEDASNEVLTLRTILETFDQGNVAKDDEHRLTLKKVNDELEKMTQSLQARIAESTGQIADLHQKYAQEIEDVKAEMVQHGENANQELQERHDTLLQMSKETRESHLSQLEALETEHRNSIQGAQRHYETRIRELESQLTDRESQIVQNDANGAENVTISQADHHKVIEDLQSQHQSTLSNAEKAHEAAIAELQEQLSKSRNFVAGEETRLQPNDLVSAFELEDLRAQLAQATADVAATKVENANLRRQKMQIEALRRQYSADDKDLRMALATDREALNELAAAAEEVGQIMIDPTELERLKHELSDLGEKHAVELAKLRESISIEDERRDKERKQGAETRDRLAAELSTMTTQIPAKDAEIENLRDVIDLARKEMQDANARLEQARAASSEQEARHRAESAELDSLKAEVEVLKQKRTASPTKGRTRSKSTHNQELDALQTIADKERARAEQLKQELNDALGTSTKHATRLREVEAALKVTTAELTEMKTRRADGNDFTMGTPVSKQGLRTSRFSVDAKEFTPAAVREALANSNDHGNRSPKRKEEDLGAHIEGMMAGLQVQMRQIEDVNMDMLQDQQRMVNMLDWATNSRNPRSQGKILEEDLESLDSVT